MGEFFENFVRPQIIDRFDPEFAHDQIWRGLHQGAKAPGLIQAIAGKPPEDPQQKLHITLGKHLPPDKQIHARTPVWVGAGVTKTGIGLEALEQAGVGGIIIGAVLERYQAGNDKPRLWRTPEGAVANALGFNTPGMRAVRQTLEGYGRLNIPVIANIGKNADVIISDLSDEELDEVVANYVAVVEHLYEVVDGFEICTSSPNTVGLRRLLAKESLRRLGYGVREKQEKMGGPKVTSIKTSPDMDEDQAYGLIEVCHELGFTVSGSNTTISPEIFANYFAGMKGVRGGASGEIPEYRQRALDWQDFYFRNGGPDLEYWGGGAINRTRHAWDRIGHGADLVYIVGGLAYRGLGVFNRISRGLLRNLDTVAFENVRSISDFRGKMTNQ